MKSLGFCPICFDFHFEGRFHCHFFGRHQVVSPQACCICLSILDNSSEPRSCEVIRLAAHCRANMCFDRAAWTSKNSSWSSSEMSMPFLASLRCYSAWCIFQWDKQEQVHQSKISGLCWSLFALQKYTWFFDTSKNPRGRKWLIDINSAIPIWLNAYGKYTMACPAGD